MKARNGGAAKPPCLFLFAYNLERIRDDIYGASEINQSQKWAIRLCFNDIRLIRLLLHLHLLPLSSGSRSRQRRAQSRYWNWRWQLNIATPTIKLGHRPCFATSIYRYDYMRMWNSAHFDVYLMINVTGLSFSIMNFLFSNFIFCACFVSCKKNVRFFLLAQQLTEEHRFFSYVRIIFQCARIELEKNWRSENNWQKINPIFNRSVFCFVFEKSLRARVWKITDDSNDDNRIFQCELVCRYYFFIVVFLFLFRWQCGSNVFMLRSNVFMLRSVDDFIAADDKSI